MGYGNLFHRQVGGTSAAEKFIATVWVHVQTFFCLPSLKTKILIERLPGIKHYRNVDLSDRDLKKMESYTERDLNGADLMFYIGGSKCKHCSQGGGKAYMRAVCQRQKRRQKYKQGIGLWSQSHASVADLVSHEIGHTLGMQHDFHKSHGGTGFEGNSTNPCNHKGIMSYSGNPKQWSDCSVKDFTAHYYSLKHNWCLPGKIFLIRKIYRSRPLKSSGSYGNSALFL